MNTLLPALTLAYRPFLDPIDISGWWWWLVIPMAFLISMVYKAIRVPTMRRYWRQVVKMTVQVMVVMLLMCIGLYVIVLWAAPRYF
ncbi:MAG: hypothetical protein KJZ69_09940 [Phycisphaerales bacterium]|nr:hypothetical protein [Phycisphaerales bacterium]